MRKPLFSLALALAACGSSSVAADVDLSKLPPPSTQAGVTYEKDIRPLLEASCVRCHGAQKPKAALRLDSLEGVLKGSEDGKVIVSGKSAESKLVISVARLNPKTAMPPTPREPRPGGATSTNAAPAQGQPQRRQGPPAKPLTAEQVGLVRAWIDQGTK